MVTLTKGVCGIVLVTLTVFVSIPRPVHGQGTCTGVSPCKCMFDNGTMLDLSALGREDGLPRFNKTSRAENTFLWNPCYNFTFGPQCQGVAICEIQPAIPKNIVIAVGYQNEASFTAGPNKDLQLVYTTHDQDKGHVRTSFVTLVCSEGDAIDDTTLEVQGEVPPGSHNYYFTLRSSAACPRDQQSTTRTPSVSTASTLPSNSSTMSSTKPPSNSSTSPTPTIPSTMSSTKPPSNSSTSPTPSIPSTMSSTKPPSNSSTSPTPTNPSTMSSTKPPGNSSTSPTPSNPSTMSSTKPPSNSSTSPTPSVSSPSSTLSSTVYTTSVSTKPPTTSKPDKSNGTITALLVVAVILVVALSVALTLVVLKMKGKICRRENYDNL